MTVPMTPAARDAFRDLGAGITRQLREVRGTAYTAILARVAENAAKLALVCAVGRDPVAPAIDLAEADWAIGFVRHFAERTVRAVERHVADNDTERNHKRLLEIIRQASPAGISKTELTRRSQFLDRRTRDEILSTLTEAGLVESRMQATSTRPTAVLVITGEQRA
jgi:hypothetical protein